MECASVHSLAVHSHIGDRAGMQVFADLAVDGLKHDHHTGDLHAASGTARAGADKHDQHQDRPRILGPLVKVRRRKSRGRDDRSDLEGCLLESDQDGREHVANIDGDRDDRERDDAKISLDLGHLGHFTEFSSQNEEIRVEVDAEHDDEDRDDDLQQSRIARAAVVSDTETAGTCAAERNAKRVEHGHAADQQTYDLCDGDPEIDGIQYFGSVLHAGHEFADRGARAFRTHQVHVVAARHGKHGQDEDDDAHTADPVGKASPEEARVAQGFNVSENTGSRRRKAGNSLKQRVRKIRNIACDHERDGTQNTQDDPAQSDDDQSFSRVIGLIGQFERGDQPSGNEVHESKDKIYNDLFLSIEQSADCRKKEECADEFHDDTEDPANDRIIHKEPPVVT